MSAFVHLKGKAALLRFASRATKGCGLSLQLLLHIIQVSKHIACTLLTHPSSGSLNARGLGLPGCGRGVTEPACR